MLLLFCSFLVLSGIECSNSVEIRWIGYVFEKYEIGDVKFYLFNRNETAGSDAYTINSVLNISSIFTNFFPEAKTKIIIHGWTGSRRSHINKVLKKAYLSNYGYNIIIVDWSKAGANISSYFTAVKQVSGAAEQLGIFIERLCYEFHLRPEDLHLIGHSLGAHVAGLSHKNISIGKLGRITGLDPARPSFYHRYPEDRISANSALFVDIIHTCGGYLATPYQIGHADFFPNDGLWRQPGCGYDLGGSCSHQRAYRYYAESIRYPLAFISTPCIAWKTFKARVCDSFAKVTMGEFTPTWAFGSYYLYTNKEPPYSLNSLSNFISTVIES